MTARIRVIDLETTGLAPPEHAPVEIAVCDLRAAGTDLAGEPCHWQVEGGDFRLCHPGRAIPPESSAIHHIIDEDVAHEVSWAQVANAFRLSMTEEIIAFAAHNAKFEQQWLTEDMTGGLPWVCTYKCALRLWPDAPSHSNSALRYWRNPQGLDRATADRAHRAYPDAYVTAFLLRDMLDEVPLEQLVKWSNEPALLTKIPFGDLRGQPWSEADNGLLEWILRKDFSEDIHFTARAELAKRGADYDDFNDEDDAA